MGSKFFFTLGFVIPFHFIKRIADERAKGLELPVTLGATEALKILAPNPFQCALHKLYDNTSGVQNRTTAPISTASQSQTAETPDDRGVRPRPPRKSISGGASFTLMEE
jgi:hypothetical protein